MAAITRSGLIIAACVWLAAPSAHAQSGNAAQGQRLARTMCAECHLVAGEAARSPNANAPSFQAIANTPGMTSIALTAALRTSHRNMPNVIVQGAEADDIIAYILSLNRK